MNRKTIDSSREIRLWVPIVIAGITTAIAIAPTIKKICLKIRAKMIEQKLKKGESKK